MAIWKKSKLIGKKVDIPDENGQFLGDWGIVIGYDGEYYHIAFAGDEENTLVFLRSEFKVCRTQSKLPLQRSRW